LFLGKHLVGNTVRIEVYRQPENRRLTVTATLAKYFVEGPIIATNRPPARGGLRVDYISILSQRPMPWGTMLPEGVVIREVVPNSAADKAQLQVDKVITHVDDQPVKTPAEFYRLLAQARAQVELTVLTSNGRPEHLTLPLK
jgi:S1-C subfamily serine protease